MAEGARTAVPRAPQPAPETARGGVRSTRRIQRRPLALSHPHDASECEATLIARAIVAMPHPGASADAPSPIAPAQRVGLLAARAPAPAKPASDGAVAPALASEIKGSLGGGQPLSPAARTFMEPRFRANFAGVRVHVDGKAAGIANQLGAAAFTYGRDIFFARGAYQPDSPQGLELLAHELTHTIQQREAVQREAATPVVSQRNPPMVQRSIVSRALDWVADKAANIPGFTLLTVILGRNPISMASVARSGENILAGLIEFIPGGHLIVEALRNHGVMQKGGKFIEDQFAALRDIGGAIRDSLMRFIDSLGLSDLWHLRHLGDLWDRAKRIFTDPVDRIIAFGKGLVSGIASLVKEAIVKPLGRWAASNIPKWNLLVGVFGKNPISDEGESPASQLIGAFMELIGQQEIWENIKKGNAVARAWAWFQTAMKGALSLVTSIPGRVMATIRSLTIFDIVTIVGAFGKIVGAFSSFVGDFVRWAGGTVLNLLEIILTVVAPSVVPYLKKAGAAFSTIIRNPISFVRTLIAAGKRGFQQFASNFLNHLKAALIGWMTGALGGAGVYIPQGLTFREILKFALSVMGLTWNNIRAKLVAATNETVVKALETGFDIVKTLVIEGPAAAWQKIMETLTNLKQMAIDAIMDFVKSKVVEAAVTKLLSMLNPAGAFIQAIIAIYNTVMFFVERLRQIAQVAAAFIDGIAAIAAGNIAPAAVKVETTMAGLLTLVISFLARLAGLGKVSDAVHGLIKKIRDPIDKALDKVVAWIVETAKKLGKMAKDGVSALIEWWKAKAPFTNRSGERHTVQFIGSGEQAQIGMASTTPKPAQTILDEHGNKHTDEWKAANDAFEAAKRVVFRSARKDADGIRAQREIAGALARMAAAFARLPDANDVAATPPTFPADYGAGNKIKYGDIATLDPAWGEQTGGQTTKKWPQDSYWKPYQDAGLTDQAKTPDKWVQMHIISKILGGQAIDENLIPAPNSVNTGPFLVWERKVAGLLKEKTGTYINRVWVQVSVAGGRKKPVVITGKAGVYLWRGRKDNWVKNSPTLSVAARIPEMPLANLPRKLLVNITGKTEMRNQFGLNATESTLIYQNRYYTGESQLRDKLKRAGLTDNEVQAILDKAKKNGGISYGYA
jgi:hypothetical protein